VINFAVVARRSTGTWLVTVVTLASCVAVGACGAIPESPAAQQTTSPPVGVSAHADVETPPETVERLRTERASVANWQSVQTALATLQQAFGLRP